MPKTGFFLDRPDTTTRRPLAAHRWWLASLSAMVLSLIAGAAKPGTAASGFEAPPVLQAADLAPADLLQGPWFRVEPRVPTDGLLAKFKTGGSWSLRPWTTPRGRSSWRGSPRGRTWPRGTARSGSQAACRPGRARS